jgi:hypothetical protein
MLRTIGLAGVLIGAVVALGAGSAADSKVAGAPGSATNTDSDKQMHALPGDEHSFVDMGVLAAWVKYKDGLTWGQGQTVAVLDDGCDIDRPEYKVAMPWGPKVIATWNSVENNADPRPIPPAYHGTTMPFPSSLNYDGKAGIAFNDFVAPVRCVRNVHIRSNELNQATESMKRALEWVLENRERLNITAVNLSPLDDVAHPGPVTSALDPVLQRLREQNVWVSAPCGNNGHTNGISWPAVSPWCFAIGASDGYYPGPHAAPHAVRFDRSKDADILALAGATSSANAYLVGSAVVLREAIEKARFDWKAKGKTLPDAMLAIFKETGEPAVDKATGLPFISVNLLNALDRVMSSTVPLR